MPRSRYKAVIMGAIAGLCIGMVVGGCGAGSSATRPTGTDAKQPASIAAQASGGPSAPVLRGRRWVPS
jgi:hypothetical protein